MHPLLHPRTTHTRYSVRVTCTDRRHPSYKQRDSATVGTSGLLQWVSYGVLSMPSLSDHIFMSKVRCPRECNLLQFSLDSCIGICFPLVSFLSFRTDVRSKSTQNSQANICQWLPLPVSCLRIFCFDSLWPFCIQPASTAEHCFLEFFTIFGTRGNLHRLHLQEQTVELQSVSSAISSSL